MDLIGPLQIRVMHYLWVQGPSTVHDVHDALNAQPGAPSLAYTTFLTVMRNLAKRGILTQTPGGRSHVFTPAVDERTYKTGLLRHLRHEFFGGDLRQMLNHLSADESLSPADRSRLTAAIE